MDECEDSVGTHPVAPFARAVRGQCLAEGAWIGASVKVVFDPGCQDLGVKPVHLLELFACSRGQLNAVAAGSGWH